MPACSKSTLESLNRKYHWCPVNNISNFGNYTWNKNFTEGDFTLKGWPIERSRDPKIYINLENLTVMDFHTCEKGNNFHF